MIFKEYKNVKFTNEEFDKIKFQLDNYLTNQIRSKQKKINNFNCIKSYLKNITLDGIAEVEYKHADSTDYIVLSIKFKYPIEIGIKVYNNVILNLSSNKKYCTLQCQRTYNTSINPVNSNYKTEYFNEFLYFFDDLDTILHQLGSILIDKDIKYYKGRKEDLEKELELVNKELKEAETKLKNIIND